VAGVLIASVVASLVFPKEAKEHTPVTHDPTVEGDEPTADAPQLLRDRDGDGDVDDPDRDERPPVRRAAP
jgi:hypothetical protein